MIPKMIKIIAEHTGRNISEIYLDSTFDELGIDLLEEVELLMKLEDIVDVEIENAQQLVTIWDLFVALNKEFRK
ncbi:MAG: acyl carrier protein [Clostridia bacterium]|nr:acyl carrier protein [Clostridia bacterium]MBQ2326963.1 acyl carrier protein [Clostridia bacterium]MBQ5813828.1 acyl carrier protein [Clostridia bacterium]